MTDFLPIGSVVTLKNGKLKLMIIGYPKVLRGHRIKSKDYIACIYPLGLMDLNNLLLFKHEEIEKIHILGPNSQEFINYKEKVLNTPNN